MGLFTCSLSETFGYTFLIPKNKSLSLQEEQEEFKMKIS